MYKCPLKVACRSNVRIEMWGYVCLLLLTKVGKRGRKLVFPPA